MRSLAETRVLLRASLAGALTALACYPRLAHWTRREDDVWFLVAVAAWAVKLKLGEPGFRLLRSLAHLLLPASEVRLVAAK